MKYKALIIDDNPADMILHSSILEGLGFRCLSSTDEDSVIKLLLQHKFDLILLDWNMPQFTGMQFLSGFREAPLNKEAPVIVVSGDRRDIPQEVSRILGAEAFIKKPLSQNQSLQQIKDIMKRKTLGGHAHE